MAIGGVSEFASSGVKDDVMYTTCVSRGSFRGFLCSAVTQGIAEGKPLVMPKELGANKY